MIGWSPEKIKGQALSPGGYLVDSIRKNYAGPKEFKSKVQLAEEADAKREAAHLAAQKRRERDEQVAAEEQKNKSDAALIDAYLGGLSEAEVRELEA